MSFTVVRGNPTGAQLYLDRVIDDILKVGATRSGAKRPEDVNLIEIIYYCMKTNPDRVHMINGATDEEFTNKQILERAVSIARAFRAKGTTGTTVVSLTRNHEHMAALYYAMLLADVISFCLEPSTSGDDLDYFLSLASPSLIFCEPSHRDEVDASLLRTGVITDVVPATKSSLDEFAQGHSEDIDSFELPDLCPGSPALMLHTSGSTGRPASMLLTHEGLIAQLPFRWIEGSKYPRPTGLALHLTTGQWLSHAKMMNSCPVYQVPLLVSPECTPNTPEKVVHLVKTYRPTYTFTNVYMGVALANMMSAKELSSFEVIGIAGTHYADENIACLKAKLPESTLIANNYGITEMQGSLAMTTRSAPAGSVGEFHNFVHYKIVDEESGTEISEPNKKGELYVKTKYIIKGYVNSERSINISPDGWMKTGDVFFKDLDGYFYFAHRRSLGFEVLGKTVYPEEVELAICSVPGVLQCVVCASAAGAAAAVVLQPDCCVTREQILQAVICSQTDHSCLRGGIAFVESLIFFKGGKINRKACAGLIKTLTMEGRCF